MFIPYTRRQLQSYHSSKETHKNKYELPLQTPTYGGALVQESVALQQSSSLSE
jgi:hypothetical protein